LLGCLVGWLIDCLGDLLIGWLVGELVGILSNSGEFNNNGGLNQPATLTRMRY
jgi:hypothetical protein